MTTSPGVFGGPDGVFVYRTTPPAPASPPAPPADDAPPTVSFTGPADGARLSGTPMLTADAADDRGVTSVRFMAGARVLCTDTTAPYACPFPLTGADVGRATLVAVATDGAGQTASAVRSVRVRRFTPSAVTARTKRSGPRVTTSGRVRLPKGVTAKQACGSGLVGVQLQAGRKTISTRRVEISRSCAFRSSRRVARSGRLTVRVRFLGNSALAARGAKKVTLRP